MSARYKLNKSVYYLCQYDVVWCSKYRKKVLKKGIAERFEQIVADICKERKSSLIKIRCAGNHVRILVEVSPQDGIHRLVKKIKRVSAGLLREEFPFLKGILPSLWTNNYFVSTVGRTSLGVIEQYIQNQPTRYEEVKAKGWNNDGRL